MPSHGTVLTALLLVATLSLSVAQSNDTYANAFDIGADDDLDFATPDDAGPESFCDNTTHHVVPLVTYALTGSRYRCGVDTQLAEGPTCLSQYHVYTVHAKARAWTGHVTR